MPRPALLTHVSIRPKRSTASPATRLTCDRSATSHGTTIACPPAAVIRFTTSSIASSLRAARTPLPPHPAARPAAGGRAPLHDLAHRLLAAGRQHDLRARPGGGLGGGEPDPAGGARDDNYL